MEDPAASRSSSSLLPGVESPDSAGGFSHQRRNEQTPLPAPFAYSRQNTRFVSSSLSRTGMDLSIPWQAPPGETDSPTYNWPDAPDTDVEDNEKVREPGYKMNQALPTIPGHEKTGLKESKPAERPKMHIPKNDHREFKTGTADISHEDAKAFLMDMTSHRCCYGNRAAKELEIQNIEYSAAAHYTLETFVESRTSRRLHIPYKGQDVDSPQDGIPPSLWDAPNEADQKYSPGVQTRPVPHTSTIETCYACSGRGFNKCYRCKGRGKTKCRHCKAKGQRGNKDCEYCRGKGRQRCFRCNGHALISCSVCETHKQLVFYVEVTSKFNVKKDEYLHHGDKRLPRKLLRGIEGITLFEEDAQSVAPVSNFPSPEVNSQSERFVSKHAGVKTERLVQQRHKLVGIPIAQVEYTWNGKTGKYWLYGEQHNVYAPDYPQQCCCSCSCTII